MYKSSAFYYALNDLLNETDTIKKAKACLFIGEYKMALEFFNEELICENFGLAPNLGIYASFLLDGQLDLAYKKMKFILKIYSNNPYLMYNCALCQLVRNKYESAISKVRKTFLVFDTIKVETPIIKKYKENLYRIRAISYFQLGYVKLAAQDYCLWRKCLISQANTFIIDEEIKDNAKEISIKLQLRTDPTMDSDTIIDSCLFVAKDKKKNSLKKTKLNYKERIKLLSQPKRSSLIVGKEKTEYFKSNFINNNAIQSKKDETDSKNLRKSSNNDLGLRSLNRHKSKDLNLDDRTSLIKKSNESDQINEEIPNTFNVNKNTNNDFVLQDLHINNNSDESIEKTDERKEEDQEYDSRVNFILNKDEKQIIIEPEDIEMIRIRLPKVILF